MAASVVEQILARVAAALAGATDAGARVYRGRADAFDTEEIPALNLRRASSSTETVGNNGARMLVEFDIEHIVDDNNAAWETAADALHMQVHGVLANDAPLATLGRGLRCTGTDAQGDSADRVIGRLTASYQMQVFVRPGDLTRPIN